MHSSSVQYFSFLRHHPALIRHRLPWLLALLLLVRFTGWGQVTNQRYAVDNYRPVSPGAYAITKYVDNPVDLYHGLPEISLPITELKLDGRSFPVAFNYHAGGIRVTEEASWVGLGWDLQLPTIMQLVNDEDDLQLNDNNRQQQPRMRPDWPVNGGGLDGITFPKRYKTYSITLDGNRDGIGWYTPFPKDPLTGAVIPNVPTKRHYYMKCYDYSVPVNNNFDLRPVNIFDNIVDSEPDVFKISLFGTSLTFVRDWATNNFRLLNNTTYKVWRVGSQEWDVVDGQGYTYHFANRQTQTSTVSSGSAFGSSYSEDALSTVIWYLTSITSPHGRQLTITYTTLPEVHVTVDYKDKYQEVTYTNQTFRSSSIEAYTAQPNQGGSIYVTKSFTKEHKVYPALIAADNAAVQFYTSTRTDIAAARKLDSIWVRDYGQQVVLKRLVLHQDYLAAQVPPTAAYATTFSTLYNNVETQRNDLRLRLTSLYESTSGTYGFSYDPQLLPPRNSFAQDFWGYPNGAYTNGSLAPNPIRLGLTDFASANLAAVHLDNNNSAVLTYARAGTLTCISFPTGGSRTFAYELNSFRLPNGQVPDADSLNNKLSKGNGLRLRRSVSDAGLGTAKMATVYRYAGGLTMAPNKYYRTFSYNYSNGQEQPGNYNGNEAFLVYLYNARELAPTSQYSPGLFGSGSGVGYFHVTEEHQVSDVSTASGTAGTTEYFYANRADVNQHTNNSGIYYTLEIPSGLSLPFYPDYTVKQNGLLDSTLMRNEQGQLVSKTTSTYRTLTSQLDYGVKIFSGGSWISYYGNDGNTNQPRIFLVSINYLGYYPLFEKTSAKTSETTTRYDASGSAHQQKTTYLLDDLNRVITKRLDNSATAIGQAALTLPGIVYTYQYPDYRFLPADQGLITANRLDEPVSMTEVHALDTRFQATPGLAGFAYRYDKYYGWNNSRIVLDSVRERTSYLADHRIQRRYTVFSAYTAWDQPRRVVVGAGRPTTRLWHPTLPLLLAEASNADPDQVLYSSFEPGTKEGWGTDFPATGGVTGTSCYSLATSLNLPNLYQAGTYALTYWTKGGSVSVSASATTATVSTPQVAAVRPDGWTQYRQLFTFIGAGVHLSFAASAGVLLDEVRLCPTTTQLITFTYDAWQHVSSQTDPTGRITTYEYDAAGRLLRTRDEQGRILAQQQYHYAQP